MTIVVVGCGGRPATPAASVPAVTTFGPQPSSVVARSIALVEAVFASDGLGTADVRDEDTTNGDEYEGEPTNSVAISYGGTVGPDSGAPTLTVFVLFCRVQTPAGTKGFTDGATWQADGDRGDTSVIEKYSPGFGDSAEVTTPAQAYASVQGYGLGPVTADQQLLRAATRIADAVGPLRTAPCTPAATPHPTEPVSPATTITIGTSG